MTTHTDLTVQNPADAGPIPFELYHLGVVMEPEAGNPLEVEGA